MDMGLDQAMGAQQQGDPLQALSEPQQEQYRKFYNMGRMLLTEETFMKKAKEMLKKFNSPVEAMAQILSAIASRLALEAQKAQDPIEPVVLLYGGSQLAEKVYEFAVAAGIEVTEDMIEDSFYRAADLFREVGLKRGLFTEEQLIEAYDAARQEYGDDLFEEYGERVKNIAMSNMPEQARKAMQPSVGGEEMAQ